MSELDSKDSIYREPRVTISILANIPDCLRNMLQEHLQGNGKRTSILVSSNNLANRFILERWGIRSSQRRRYKNLFSTIRKHCRAIFRNYLVRGKLIWKARDDEYMIGVFKYDEVRGNLILGFVPAFAYTDWRYVTDET
jgi:hypothetical protein